jgi:homoserine O-acetyltransferase
LFKYKNNSTYKAGPEPQYARIVSGFEKFTFKKKFICENGGHLPEVDIAYETWGTLNSDKSNAILLHTGLSASSHAKSHHNNREPGWWEKFIGPGLAIDTNKYYSFIFLFLNLNRFFVVCTNILGGCYGTSGPSSINPETGKRYAMSFPLITVFDAIRAQFLLLDNLGVKTLHASVGSSLVFLSSPCEISN